MLLLRQKDCPFAETIVYLLPIVECAYGSKEIAQG